MESERLHCLATGLKGNKVELLANEIGAFDGSKATASKTMTYTASISMQTAIGR
jgi:hypothetical protein